MYSQSVTAEDDCILEAIDTSWIYKVLKQLKSEETLYRTFDIGYKIQTNWIPIEDMKHKLNLLFAYTFCLIILVR